MRGELRFPSGAPRGYRKPVTEDEYRKLFRGESVLMRGVSLCVQLMKIIIMSYLPYEGFITEAICSSN